MVRAAAGGSLAAWHALVADHAGLVHAVIRRYFGDADEARHVEVEVFERLYRGGLNKYEGRSAFSTWLVVVARSTALDHLRRSRGRRRLPEAVQRLPEREQQVFVHYFHEGWGLDAILAWAASRGEPFDRRELCELLSRLHASLSRRQRRELAYATAARAAGAPSGRVLEYLDHRRQEIAEQAEQLRPDAALLAEEASRTLERIHEEIAALPQVEQDVIALRFEAGCTAKEIAARLRLGDQRRAYTLIERALRRIRRALGDAARDESL
jgi:DNA-directed RNA polymerase specialized sigma24 family protein